MRLKKCSACGAKAMNQVRCESCSYEVPIRLVYPIKCDAAGCQGWHFREKKGHSNCSLCNSKYKEVY